jgi:cytochrome c oxidase subunit III
VERNVPPPEPAVVIARLPQEQRREYECYREKFEFRWDVYIESATEHPGQQGHAEDRPNDGGILPLTFVDRDEKPQKHKRLEHRGQATMNRRGLGAIHGVAQSYATLGERQNLAKCALEGPLLQDMLPRMPSSLRPREFPGREPSFEKSAAQIGMYIGLASLTMVFGGTLVAYFITRASSTVWRSPEMPHPPGGLWASTFVLLLLSGSLHYALRRLSRNSQTGLMRGLLSALALSAAFLLAQVQNWRSMATELVGVEIKSLYAFCFYLLTALHALHVLFGIFPLAYVYFRAKNEEYSSSRNEGVVLLRQYWDFLLVVWFVLWAALLF